MKRQEHNLFVVRDASRRTLSFGPSGGERIAADLPSSLPRVALPAALGAALVEVQVATSPPILVTPCGQVQSVTPQGSHP